METTYDSRLVEETQSAWGAVICLSVLTFVLVASEFMPVSLLTPIARDLGGGLQVALIQFAITFGAFAGGLLFDSAGWWGPFVLGAALLVGSAPLAIAAWRSTGRVAA